MDSSSVTKVAWSSQHPQVILWKGIIEKCHLVGRLLMPVVVTVFMIIYWTYAVLVYNRD